MTCQFWLQEFLEINEKPSHIDKWPSRMII